jgi:hypothetical protein
MGRDLGRETQWFHKEGVLGWHGPHGLAGSHVPYESYHGHVWYGFLPSMTLSGRSSSTGISICKRDYAMSVQRLKEVREWLPLGGWPFCGGCCCY